MPITFPATCWCHIAAIRRCRNTRAVLQPKLCCTVSAPPPAAFACFPCATCSCCPPCPYPQQPEQFSPAVPGAPSHTPVAHTCAHTRRPAFPHRRHAHVALPSQPPAAPNCAPTPGHTPVPTPRVFPFPQPPFPLPLPQLCPDPLSTPLARFAPSLLGRLAEGQLRGTGGSWAVVKYSSGGWSGVDGMRQAVICVKVCNSSIGVPLCLSCPAMTPEFTRMQPACTPPHRKGGRQQRAGPCPSGEERTQSRRT